MKSRSFERAHSSKPRVNPGPSLRQGQPVILRNGQTGILEFISMAMKVARVRLAGGRTRTVKLSEIAPAAPQPRREPNDRSNPSNLHEDGDDRFDDDDGSSASGDGHADAEEAGQKQEDIGDEEHEENERDAAAADEAVQDQVAQDQVVQDQVAQDKESDENSGRNKPEVLHTIERARPVAGQRPLVSDRVSAQSEKGIAGAPRPVTSRQRARLGKKDPESGRAVMQPTDSIRENERLAAQAAPELETRLSQLAARVPGVKFVRLRPQKNPVRLRDKIRGEDKPAETISDYLASQIAADSPQAKDQMIARMRREFHVINVEDSFLQGREDKAGYPSANVQVQLSNGATAEVQIVPREVQQSTDQSHHFYKMGREARDAGKTALSRRYFDQAKAINERALARFRIRNGMRKQRAIGN